LAVIDSLLKITVKIVFSYLPLSVADDSLRKRYCKYKGEHMENAIVYNGTTRRIIIPELTWSETQDIVICLIAYHKIKGIKCPKLEVKANLDHMGAKAVDNKTGTLVKKDVSEEMIGFRISSFFNAKKVRTITIPPERVLQTMALSTKSKECLFKELPDIESQMLLSPLKIQTDGTEGMRLTASGELHTHPIAGEPMELPFEEVEEEDKFANRAPPPGFKSEVAVTPDMSWVRQDPPPLPEETLTTTDYLTNKGLPNKVRCATSGLLSIIALGLLSEKKLPAPGGEPRRYRKSHMDILDEAYVGLKKVFVNIEDVGDNHNRIVYNKALLDRIPDSAMRTYFYDCIKKPFNAFKPLEKDPLI
jgi:hypothetical protein